MAESKPFLANTVLVLGAGASKPYGFPLGEQLKNHIIDNTTPAALDALNELRYDLTTIREFKDALRWGDHATIDIFLERKTNFREIGSYFIAAAIGEFEKGSSPFPARDWYLDLFRLLDLETLQGNLPNLSIVTLNYDRSLEHFLKMYINYRCQAEIVRRCHERRSRLSIIHAHGSIGPYPETQYGDATSDKESLRRAATRIRIVSDKLEESPDFRAAQDAIAEAKHIIFLGFGYNDQTLRALLSKRDLSKTRFYGTAMQLNNDSRRDITEFFHGNINLGGADQDCLKFFRETVLNTKL